MAVGQLFRQALKSALCPRWLSLLDVPPSALRPLSSVAAPELAEPLVEPLNPLPINQDASFSRENLTRERRKATSGSLRGAFEHQGPAERGNLSSEETSQGAANTGQHGRKDEGGKASGQSLGGGAALHSSERSGTGPPAFEKRQISPYLKRVYKRNGASDADPDFFPEKRGKSFDRTKWDLGPKPSPALEGKSPFVKRSDIDPAFQHALPPQQNEQVERLIHHITQIDSPQVAPYLTANGSKLDARSMYCVVMRLARRGFAERAYDVLVWYREQPEYEPDPILYHVCIFPLQPEQYFLGWKFFQALVRDGCGTSSTAYVKLLRLTAQSNAFWRAFEIMEELRRHVPGRPDVRDFNNLLGSLLRTRRPIPCEKVFLKMNIAEGNFGVQPDIVSYNTLMSCYAREGHYRKVEALLVQMQRAHIEPDAYTCSTVVQAYGKANLLPKAIRAFEEMKAAGYKPNVIVYNSLLTTLSKAMMPKYAEKVVTLVEEYLEMMKADGYEADSSTKKALVLTYAKAGMFDKAEEIIAGIHATGERVRPLLWHAYITGFAEMGRVDDTLNTIARFCAEGYQPGFVVRNAMMMAYAKAGELDKAEEELRGMREDGVELMQSACNAMLAAYARSGQTHKIAPFFKVMEESNVSASTVTYKVLIAAYGDVGQFDMVDELMEFIREFQHVKLVAFNQLVKTYAQANKIDKMEEAFAIIKYRSFRPGKVIIGEMAAAYERAGMKEKAAQFNELLRQLLEQNTDEYYGFFDDERPQDWEDEKEGLTDNSEHLESAG